MLLIVGLGNPGLNYRNTYHNSGFQAVDAFVSAHSGRFSKTLCRAKVCELYIRGERIVVAKPQTYMNLSGESVRELMGRYSASLSDTIIVYDDIDIAPGEVRFREHGSAGTHNGMRNIVALCGEPMRIRLGIGKPTVGALYDYVLSRPTGEKRTEWQSTIQKGTLVLEHYVEHRDVAAALASIH